MQARQILLKAILLIFLLYLFVLSIQMMGASFKLMGSRFAETLIQTTSNPVVGLLIGIRVTSIIQSSSTTTSIAVGCVAREAHIIRGYTHYHGC